MIRRIGINTRQFLVIPVKEERQWFQALEAASAQNEQSIRDKIIEANLGLVIACVRSIQKQPTGNLDVDDLFQEGVIGLAKAVDTFDWLKGNRFSTYAIPCITRAIWREVVNNGMLIRIPVYAVNERRMFVRTQGELEKKLGRKPLSEDISAEIGVSETDIAESKRIIALGAPQSLDEQLYDDNEATLLKFISTNSGDDKEINEYFLRKAVEAALELLGNSPRDIRQRKVLELRFGLSNDGKQQTLEVISKKFGLTRERINKIEKKALARLRKNQRVAELLQDFY